jgi:putative spermidine/putrescine transport system permease protein
MDRPPSRLLTGFAVLAFGFLLAPVILVFPLSFSGDPVMAFPPGSWSAVWYGRVLQDDQMIGAFRTSLLLGSLVTGLSLVMGLPAAYAVVRLRPPGGIFLYNLFTAPLLLPTIVLGLALLVVLASVGLLGRFPGLALAHLVMTMPYALRVLATALGGITPALEEAAATLGAGRLTIFRKVTLPLMIPGLVAAGALCFLVSFDEVVASLFLTGPGLTTLPVQLFHHAEGRADPEVAAISVLLIALTLAVVVVMDRSLGIARALVK